MLSVMLSLLLACLFAGAGYAGTIEAPSASAPIVKPLLTQPIDVASHQPQKESSDAARQIEVEQRSPAKSLSPNLTSILRNGSFIPERMYESEPTYELVVDFAEVHANTLVWRVYLTLDNWYDWTLHPPSTMHRIAGWKESNILYRFISQADA
ncbi:hypothetical protein H2O73_01780 [Vibrio sp. 404]|uniref:Uncharacterized protein n=1 Tax=Vibrio marinisediminis TaxID=2758441 RepID=A0A7W2FMX2_9VIBR|nr:hypothetical protein [Vibrio marinisediminis]